MRDYINKLSRGQYIYRQPKFTADEELIEADVVTGEITEYQFRLSSEDSAKDLIYSSNPKVRLVQNGFSGKDQMISYKVHAQGVLPGNVIKGKFHVVSNAGEMEVSYIFHVKEKYFDTSLGKAFNLFHFTNLVHTAPKEAARLFASDGFADVFLGEDEHLRNTYEALLDLSHLDESMEEFLLILRKKTQVVFSIDYNRKVYDDFHGNQKEILTINKSSWGYFVLQVKTDAPFIKLASNRICSDEFTGGKFCLEYILDEKQMHAGVNLGRIYVKSFYQTFTIEIEVHNVSYIKDTIDESLFPENAKEIKQAKKALTQEYLEYRMKKISMKTWILRSNQILDRVRGLTKQDPYFDLAQAQMFLMEKREEEGRWILDYLKGQIMSDISEHVELYCYYLYVNSLLIHSREYTQEAIDIVTKYYENGYDSWQLLWILFYLKGNQDSNASVKLIRIKDTFKTGCTSPIMYFEACAILNNQPQLLRVLNAFERQIIIFGCKHDLIQEKLALQISDIIGNEKLASIWSINILKYIYRIYDNDEILTTLVTHMIRNACISKSDFVYYEKGVLRGLRITRLYEYYLVSLNRNYNKKIPKVVLMYFQYDHDLEYGLKAYLYANIINNKKYYGDVYSSYEKDMELFVYEQLKEGHIDDSLVTLYRTFWKTQLIRQDTRDYMAQLLFMHKFTCFEEGIAAIAVKHKEQKAAVVYPLIDHQAFVPIYTDFCSVVFICDDGVLRKDSINYEMEKVFPDMPLKEELLEEESGNSGIQLYRAVLFAQRAEYTADAVSIWLELTDHNDINAYFHKMLHSWIIHYYYEFYTGENFRSIYERLMKKELKINTAKELIECCINFGLYMEAYELISIYGYENISPARLFRLVRYMVGIQSSDYNELLVEMGSFIFRNKVYNEDVLEYMIDFYNGTNDDMYCVWKACLNFSMNVVKLSERVLAQFLFTGEHTGRMTEVFTHYYQSGVRNDVVQAYISFNAYHYLIHETKANEIVFKAIENCIDERRKLPDTCYIAWLKHMTEILPEQFTDRRKLLAGEILTGLCNENKIYAFYKKFRGVLDIPYNAMDKTVIEYHANPDSKVEIHYTYNHDENQEYVTEIMKSSVGGIFTKCFTLLYGDKITYYFTVTGAGETITTEKNSCECGELNTEQSENRFDFINDCLACKELHDMVTMKKMMRSYTVKDYVTKQIFKPMKG